MYAFAFRCAATFWVAVFTAVRAAPSAPASGSGAATVTIDQFAFNPKVVTVSAGETVTWVNRDDVPHTVTSRGDSREFDSKALDTDDRFSFTFTRPGTYAYYCKVHNHMTGKVVVK